MFTLIKRIFRSGWRNLIRNSGMIIANIFIMIMVISLITSLFFFKNISQFLISFVQEKVDISVFFRQEATEEDILEVKRAIAEIPEVKEINYVSREDARKKFIERHKNDPVLMEALQEVGGNPFLASLGIKAFEAYQYKAVVNFLEGDQFRDIIKNTDYYERRPIIERIYGLTSNFNRIGIILSIILTVIAILVAFNTVKLSIYNLKEEIRVQRLVGASNWFIKGPFLVQGMIYGLFATLFCFLFFALLSWGLNSRVELLFPGFGLFNFFILNFWTILLIQLSIGVILGTIPSLIAIRKYLRV